MTLKAMEGLDIPKEDKEKPMTKTRKRQSSKALPGADVYDLTIREESKTLAAGFDLTDVHLWRRDARDECRIHGADGNSYGQCWELPLFEHFGCCHH
jgi:hypothetical protein